MKNASFRSLGGMERRHPFLICLYRKKSCIQSFYGADLKVLVLCLKGKVAESIFFRDIKKIERNINKNYLTSAYIMRDYI